MKRRSNDRLGDYDMCLVGKLLTANERFLYKPS